MGETIGTILLTNSGHAGLERGLHKRLSRLRAKHRDNLVQGEGTTALDRHFVEQVACAAGDMEVDHHTIGTLLARELTAGLPVASLLQVVLDRPRRVLEQVFVRGGLASERDAL